MATWTIKGEAAKAWDATTKSFGERKIEDGRFEFRSLDADTFQFTISAKDIAAETLPDYVQQITIYRDGTQFFVGHVTNRTVSVTAGIQTCAVTVSGPWWWMDRIPFTATNTDGTGATAERLTLAFGTASSGQDLKTSIETAINRSVDLGVPIAKTTAGTPSTVATMTTFPRITLNQSTCGQVISELVRCCADSMVYFDYTTATPTMHVTRRKSGLATGSAAATTIDATGGTVTSIDLNPMIELQVARVELPYVTRDVQGRTQFATQTFGTAASPLPKRQVLTVSGPELDTFLPNDLFDTEIVAQLTLKEYLGRKLPALAEFITTYGFNPIGGTWPSGVSTSRITFWLNGKGGTIYNFSIPPATISEAGTYLVFGSDGTKEPEQWVIDQLGLTPASLKGGLWGEFAPNVAAGETQYSERAVAFHNIFSSNYWETRPGGVLYIVAGKVIDEPITVWTAPTGATLPSGETGTAASGGINIYGQSFVVLGTSASTKDNFYNGQIITWTRGLTYSSRILDYTGSTKTAILSGAFLSTQLPTAGTTYTLQGGVLYRDADYSFISPPAGLAQFLKEAQDYVPYEGAVQVVEQDVGATRYRGTKVSVTNSLAEYSSMDALVSGESLDIKSGTTQITLGQAPRLDYRTLVDRIRKTSQDNIVYV
jgi:hypothetical protein